MTYLPVYCESCAHASLASAGEPEANLQCSFCEEPARVIPGPVYGDGDWLAFAEIDAAVFEAQLDGPQATLLAHAMQEMLDRQDPAPAIIQQMTARLPVLARCRPALVNRVPRGLRMLMTLLIARTRDEPLTPKNFFPPSLGEEAVE
ncbi:MAG: hypothetical protein EOO73_11380 [Myxococcales bacterium]|nr:MAG: hypothetical protein EOO73_11380 [Myxococcales bacterium]